jgi:hypothetical protein
LTRELCHRRGAVDMSSPQRPATVASSEIPSFSSDMAPTPMLMHGPYHIREGIHSARKALSSGRLNLPKAFALALIYLSATF